MKSFTPSFGETAKFGGDRDGCSGMEDISIPYTNFSQSIKDSWLVAVPLMCLQKM